MVYDACMSILQKHFLQSKCPKIPKAIVDELRAKSVEHETLVEAYVSSAADDKVARQIAYEAAKIEKMGVSNGPKGLLSGPVKAQESKSEVIESRKLGFTDSFMSLMRPSRVKTSTDQYRRVTDQSILTSEFTSTKKPEVQSEEKSTEDISPPVSSNANSFLSSASFRNKRSSRSFQEEATKSRQLGNDSSMIVTSSKNPEVQGEEISPPVSSNANSFLSSASFRNKRSSRSFQEEATKSRQLGNDSSMIVTSSKNPEVQGEEISPPVSSNANSFLSSASFRNKRSSRSVQEEATKSRQRGNDSSMIEDRDSEYCTPYMKLFMSLLEICCPAAGQNHDPLNRCHLRCRKCAASDSSLGVFTVVSSLYCFLFAFFSKLFFLTFS
jgi:hypothetical protein